jgi:MFS family permease
MIPARRSFILLFLANSISGVAQGISMIAIPWYYLTIINERQLLGLVYFTATFIQIFWGLYSGSLIDRYSRKKIFLCINACAGLLLIAVALTGYYLGDIPLPLISLVFASTFFVYNIHYPNLYAFAQEIVSKEAYSKINS